LYRFYSNIPIAFYVGGIRRPRVNTQVIANPYAEVPVTYWRD
jgi:hypothetical protein